MPTNDDQGNRLTLRDWLLAGTILGMSAGAIYWGGRLDQRVEELRHDVDMLTERGSPAVQALNAKIDAIGAKVDDNQSLLREHIKLMGKTP